MATDQHQESTFRSLQRVLKTGGTIFTCPDLNGVIQYKKLCIFTVYYGHKLLLINILLIYLSQVSLDMPNLLAVLPLRSLDNDCGVLFTNPVASFIAFSQDIRSQLLKSGYHFLLQSFCFHLNGNVYYV